jgi:hypothetical protein
MSERWSDASTARRQFRAMISACVLGATASACVPRVTLPDLSSSELARYAASDSARAIAVALAPVLYVQHDEPFPLLRVAAVVHPTRPLVAYHLLWQHDVNGQWMPWTKPSDEEEIWVGYDPETHAPTDMWTYWHGSVLHTSWRGKGPPAVDVQWGKHGSLPRGVIESDLPRFKTLNAFYAVEYFLLPDIWLGKLAHGGPWGFFHDYARYREFDRVVPLATRLDVVIDAEDPRDALHEIFGRKYSNKVHWPPFSDAATP